MSRNQHEINRAPRKPKESRGAQAKKGNQQEATQFVHKIIIEFQRQVTQKQRTLADFIRNEIKSSDLEKQTTSIRGNARRSNNSKKVKRTKKQRT